MSSETSILHRPAVTSHIFKFVTNTVKRAVELAHVCSDFRDAVVNYSPDMWNNIISTSDEKSKCISSIRLNYGALTFPAVAVAKHGGDAVLVDVLRTAKATEDHEFIQQLLAAVGIADLCAYLLNENQPIDADEFDAKWVAAALFRQPQEQQPHAVLEFSRRVAALPAPPSGLASSGWSFFIAVFLFAAAASSINEAATWLQRFPHRFSATHPEAREWFGQLVRARIQHQQRSDFWLNEPAPALLRIVHETRNNKAGKQDQRHRQQVITAASNAASLLFAPRITNSLAVDLSGCVLEDCNLIWADFTNAVFKSDEHGEAQLRECAVEGWIGGDNVSDETKQLLERGQRRELLKTLSGHTENVSSVAFSPDGTIIASGSWDTTIKLWDLATGMCFRTINGSRAVTTVAFSPDGKSIVSSSDDKTVKLWDVATGNCIRTLSGHTNKVSSVAFSPDGKSIVSGSGDNTVKVWDAATGILVRTLRHTNVVSSVAFSPDGKFIVSGSLDKSLKIWDAATGDCIHTLAGHTEPVWSVAVSYDIVVSGSADKTVKVWDFASGEFLRSLDAGYCVRSVALSADSKLVVAGGEETDVKLWELATGLSIRTLSGHTAAVRSVAFFPDGKSVFSGGSDKAIKMWDVATSECIRAAHSVN